jgi:hypothetical protein
MAAAREGGEGRGGLGGAGSRVPPPAAPERRWGDEMKRKNGILLIVVHYSHF